MADLPNPTDRPPPPFGALLVRWYRRILGIAFPGSYPRDLLDEAAWVFELKLRARRDAGRPVAPWVLRSFGRGVADGLTERGEEIRGGVAEFWQGISLDLRLGWRRLRGQGLPGMALLGTLVVATVPLLFAGGQMEALLRGPPDLDRPEELFSVHGVAPGGVAETPLAPAEFRAIRKALGSFARLEGWRPELAEVVSGDVSRAVPLARMTPGLPSLLGIQVTGDGWSEEKEPGLGGIRPLLLGPGVGAEVLPPGVQVGSVVTVDGDRHRIVGRVPQISSIARLNGALWLPGGFGPDDVPRGIEGSDLGDRRVRAVGRLRSEVSLDQVEARVRETAAILAQANPGAAAGRSARTQPLLTTLYGAPRRSALTVVASGLLLFTLTVLAMGSLVLLRAEQLRQLARAEAFLGASRIRRLRRTLVEGIVPVGAALLLAWLLAFLVREGMRLGGSASFPLPRPLGWTTVLVVLLPVGASALALTLQVHRLGSKGRDLRCATDPPRRSWPLALQILLATVLLTNGSSLARSAWELRDFDPGFDPGQAVAVRILLPAHHLPEGSDHVSYLRDLQAEIRGLPEVESVGILSSLPLDPASVEFDLPVRSAVNREEPWGDLPQLRVRLFTGNGPEALGLRLVEGQWPEGDGRTEGGGVLVSRSLARTLWRGQRAPGREIETPWSPAPGTVTGVVEDVRDPTSATGEATLYLPLGGVPWELPILVVRGGRSWDTAARVRAGLRAFDSTLPTREIFPLQDLVSPELRSARLRRTMLLLLALPALLVATLGTWAFVAGVLARRARELRIRRAIGARRLDLYRTVARVAGPPIAMGLLLGLPLAVGASVLMAPSALQAGPVLPPSLVAGALAVALSAAMAALESTRRVMQGEPAHLTPDGFRPPGGS